MFKIYKMGGFKSSHFVYRNRDKGKYRDRPDCKMKKLVELLAEYELQSMEFAGECLRINN